MDFINFEAEADSGDGNDEQDFDLSDDSYVIDNSSDISESACDHHAFRNAKRDVDEVLKELYEKGVSDLDKASEVTNFSNADLQEGLPEIDDFAGSHKRIDDFEKTLVILHGAGPIDSFFMQFVRLFAMLR